LGKVKFYFIFVVMENEYVQIVGGRQLTQDDIGNKVTYVPMHAGGDASHPDCEGGRIISWNSRGVFVDYGRNRCLTNAEDLIWG
jgi:hypothetical protein